MNKELPKRTRVIFNIAQGLSIGSGIIIDLKKGPEDTCFVYKIDLIEGENMEMHKNKDGEIWVNAFEIKEVAK